MIPRHHPSEDILASYSSGALEPGFGLVVGAHVEACAKCRGQVARYEAASGGALATLPQTALAPDALNRVMARLAGAEPETASTLVPRPLLQRLPLHARKWVAPGVWVAAVDTPRGPDNRVYVLSVKPGMPTALHRHSGAEFCTVLQGGYSDVLGHFNAGDFAAADYDLAHQPVVQPGQDCICLFATEGRLKAHGLLGRLAFALADV